MFVRKGIKYKKQLTDIERRYRQLGSFDLLKEAGYSVYAVNNMYIIKDLNFHKTFKLNEEEFQKWECDIDNSYWD